VNQLQTPVGKSHTLHSLMVRLLHHLSEDKHVSRPPGVGQKTVNIAKERGYIESIRSVSSGLPDLHRRTSWGTLVLQDHPVDLPRTKGIGDDKGVKKRARGNMTRRLFYRIDEPDAILRRAMIIEAGPSASVYCPPEIAQGPWIEEMTSFDAAFDLASLLARQLGQAAVLLTRDKVEWWLNGLSLIGDSDERYRKENLGIADS